MKPIVAIVGRPNVGKSTLFNRLAGSRISIVDPTPGVTRDRIYADVEWTNRKFTLIDTGGIDLESSDALTKEMLAQAEIAMETADVILFLTDCQQGVTDSDMEVAQILRRTQKPVLLGVNKVDDHKKYALDVYEFYALGLGEPIAVSGAQALGLGDLLDSIINMLPPAEDDEIDEDIIKVAIVGKPNVGKSSIINKILGENRVIVSPIAGTTRDAIDTYYEKDGQRFLFIDTAGIRRKSKIKENIERYSIIRAVSAVERADVCVLVISAEEGITDQDTKIAGIAHERGKAALIVVNKWDLVEKDDKTMKRYSNEIDTELAYMPYAPKLFVSATTGQRMQKLFELINIVYENSNMRVQTGLLNDVLIEAMSVHPPQVDKGRTLKIYYMTQVSVKPPTFVMFVNEPELLHFSYKRYIENNLRDAFAFTGTPIHFIVRKKSD